MPGANKTYEDIGELYRSKIIPKTHKQIIEEGEVTGDIPTDTFPSCQNPISPNKLYTQAGPEAAAGFKPVENDTKKKKNKDSAYNEESLSQPVKVPKNAVKKESKKINNSTMKETNKNKSTFDRLFEDVMGEDLDLEIGGDGGGFDDLGGGDELGDDGLGDEEGLDTISIDLPRDVAEQLHSALGDLLGGGDDIEDIEDTEGGDDLGLGDDLEVPESHVELTAVPDAVSGLTGQNNKVGGDATPAGGSADSGAAGQEDGGKLKAASDGVSTLTGKSNKVGGKITGGNKQAFKA